MIDTKIIEELLSQNGFVDIEKMGINNNEYVGISCVHAKDNVIGIICIQDDKFMLSSSHLINTSNLPRLLKITNDFVELYGLHLYIHDETLNFNSMEYAYENEQNLVELFVDFVQENIKHCTQILKMAMDEYHEIIINAKTLLRKIPDFKIEDSDVSNILIATNSQNGTFQILSTPTSSYEGVLTYSIPVKKMDTHITNCLTATSLDYVFYYQKDRLYVKTLHPHGSSITTILDKIAFLKYFAENLEKCFNALSISTDDFFDIIENEIKPYAEKLKKKYL